MTIVTGCSESHRRCVERLRQSIGNREYDLLVYDYDGTANGIPFHIDFGKYKVFGKPSYHPKIPLKPDVLIDAIERINGDILYLDGDTEILKDIHHIFDDDFDVAVTIHDPQAERIRRARHAYWDMSGYLNAGVIFLKNTPGTRELLKRWRKEVRCCGTYSDQHALSNILRKCSNYPDQWKFDTKIVANRTIVKFLPAPVYNYDPYDVTMDLNLAKIYHHIGDKTCVDS